MKTNHHDKSVISILYTNAQSVVNKIDELKAVTAELQPDIICICETWTHSDITKAFLTIDGYELICRKDRSDTNAGRGGGLLMYAKINLCAVESIQYVHNDFNQTCAMTIPLRAIPDLHVGLIYRPHNLYNGKDVCANNEKLSEIITSNRGKYILVGDFNFSDIDWNTLSGEAHSREFIDTIQNCFWTQHVDFATHKSGTTPDLVLSSEPDLVLGVEDVGRLGQCDHSMLLIHAKSQQPSNETFEEIPDWKHADFDKLKSILSSVDWQNELNVLNTDDSWSRFKNTLEEAQQECVPVKRRRIRNKPIWMSPNIIRVVRKKRRLWKVYKKSSDYQSYLVYKKVEKIVKDTVRKAKKNFEKKLAKNAKKNPKAFYAYLNSRTSNKAFVGPLKDNGSMVTEDSTKVEVLNSSFSSMFTKEDPNNVPVPTQVYTGVLPLQNVEFTEKDVANKINKLKSTSAPGPDNMRPQILQSLSDSISVPLTIIYRKSLEEGVVPQDWRNANITPVFKKGSKVLAENYRPISLTSVICKIMESIIRDAITHHLTVNSLINGSQHGFMARKSCLTNLLEYLEILTELVDEGHSVDVVYLDFAKAFDKVPHCRLLCKLRCHGIEGKVICWIQSWLSDRQQRVVLNGHSSGWRKVESGVPQGSVLGPMCFVVFINDIDGAIDTLASFIRKFADDTKIGRKVSCDQDRMELQKDIDSIMTWVEIWQLPVNISKCKVQHFGTNNPNFDYTIGGYAPAGTILDTVCVEKDIGVMVHSSLKPSTQCANASKKANQLLGQMKRAFHYRDMTWIKLYKTYIRPHMEFSVQAWSPWTQYDIGILESVQERAVKAVSGLKGTSYLDRLNEIGMLSLEARRVRGDMIEMWKILHQIDDVDPQSWFTMANSRHDQGTRFSMSSFSVAKPVARLEIRKNFFSVRCVDRWNSLPEKVKGIIKECDQCKVFNRNCYECRKSSLNAFKNNLDDHCKTTNIMGNFHQQNDNIV